MILPCGCDTIWSSYFDLCDACRNRASQAAQDMVKPAERNYELVGRTIVRHDGTTYREMQWK